MTQSRDVTSEVAAVSVSDSPDLAILGFGESHLKNAMADLALFMLAEGMNLVYGGDLREHGFTRLLYELTLRYNRDSSSEKKRIVNYLAWPMHMSLDCKILERMAEDLSGSGRLALIGKDGQEMSMRDRVKLDRIDPTDDQWSESLTAMRRTICTETNLRMFLGGRVAGYRGHMPDIAEEALISFDLHQTLFLIGCFGGRTRDIAETLGLVESKADSQRIWPGRCQFEKYSSRDLQNGLTDEENRFLAQTQYMDQALVMVLRGMYRLRKSGQMMHTGKGRN